MSRIAKKPIAIPEGVTVTESNGEILVAGKGGTVRVPLLSSIAIELGEREVTIKPLAEDKQARSNWGTVAALIKNAFAGVSGGFTRQLEIQGIGFRAAMEKDVLILHMGFSHSVSVSPREGVTVSVEKNIITVSGINKELVGQTAADIRSIKKPEPYKGKGIRYVGEVVRRKAGKKVAGVGSE